MIAEVWFPMITTIAERFFLAIAAIIAIVAIIRKVALNCTHNCGSYQKVDLHTVESVQISFSVDIHN